jgi:hypothetical protein
MPHGCRGPLNRERRSRQFGPNGVEAGLSHIGPRPSIHIWKTQESGKSWDSHHRRSDGGDTFSGMAPSWEYMTLDQC